MNGLEPVELFAYRGKDERCRLGTRDLQCGDCFQLLEDGKLVYTRIEHSTDWYLVGLGDARLYDGHSGRSY